VVTTLADLPSEFGGAAPEPPRGAPPLGLPTGPLGKTTSIELAKEAYPRIPGYTVLEPIGKGGMGIVYRARHEGTQREVAVKWLASHAEEMLRRRFDREARATASVRHKNVVPVLGAGSTRDGSFIVMELVVGFSLGAALEARALGPNALVSVVAKVARALEAAHARGVVHRDVKPENVIVDLAGEPRLLDFGLARFLHTEGQLTKENTVLGTLGYMAPEVFDGGGREAGPACDVFALGAILHEGLVGEPPFGKGEAHEVLQRVASGTIPPLPTSVPGPLAEVCTRALARDPATRPSACELAERLEAFASPSGEPGPPGEGKPAARRRVPLAVACLVGAALGAVVVGLASREEAPPPTASGDPLAQAFSRSEAPTIPETVFKTASVSETDAVSKPDTSPIASEEIPLPESEPAPPATPPLVSTETPRESAPVASGTPAPPARGEPPAAKTLTGKDLDKLFEDAIAALKKDDRALADGLSRDAIEHAPSGEDKRVARFHIILARDALLELKTARSEEEYLHALVLDPENPVALLGSFAGALLDGNRALAVRRMKELQKAGSTSEITVAEAFLAAARRDPFMKQRAEAAVKTKVDPLLVDKVVTELRSRDPLRMGLRRP
jgi:serine/threonine protein kinase